MPGQKAAAWVQKQVLQHNQKNIADLVDQLRSPLGVIPFVGAGLSAPFKFPQWGELLLDLTSGLSRETRNMVSVAVKKEEYTAAATIVAKQLSEFDFQSEISRRFPDPTPDRINVTKVAVAFVPLLTPGLVITTNLDRILECVFEQAGCKPELVYGANPNVIVPAIQRNQLTLWKIHGDRNDPRTRVLSTEDYDTHYVHLRELLALAFANRPALFLGCSLVKDRTVTVLANLQKRCPALKHFALLQHPFSEEEFNNRFTELEQLGIHPIWYPKGEHEKIRHYLSEIVQQASASRLVGETNPTMMREIGQLNTRNGREFLRQELTKLARHASGSTADESPQDTMPYSALPSHLIRGDLTFFLGAGATLGRLPMAEAFYETLRRLTQGPSELSDERVTQHYADRYGRDALDTQVNRMLGAARPDPSAVHWLLATLTSRLREKGYRPRSLLVLTTNFDDSMERALLAAGEPYHMFIFRVEEPHAGYFVYRSPNGEASVVDRPERFHEVSGEYPIVVKYHGGLHRDIDLPVTYAFTRCDFMRATRRLPAALPKTVLDRLTGSPLLFLGHGLTDDSVEALARDLYRRNPNVQSWAIQRSPRHGWPLYWSKIGVDIKDISLEQFVLEMDQQLETLPEAESVT
jgi:hypothetical protein